MLTKIPCKGPLIHMQSVTHTHTHSHTLNTGYCNWNKVQRDYDLTPSWLVSLPLLHSLSFFPLFSQTFSTSFAFSLAFRGLEQTDVFTHTHTWSPGRVFLLSLARLPPHFISKDSIGESLTHTHFLFLLFYVNGFQTCVPSVTPVKHTRRHRRNQGLCDCAFLRSAYLLCATTHKHTHTEVHTLPSVSSKVLKQQYVYICFRHSVAQ